MDRDQAPIHWGSPNGSLYPYLVSATPQGVEPVLYVSIVSFCYVVVSLWYIHKLHVRLRSFEEGWIEIEKLTDHNLDGDIVIHTKHLEK
jgi:hypothetical protein